MAGLTFDDLIPSGGGQPSSSSTLRFDDLIASSGGTRTQSGYQKSRAQLAQEEAARRKNALLPGVDDFVRAAVGSTGGLDEVGGAMRYLRQGGENIVRRATGQPVQISAGQAGLAAQDTERAWQARYAAQHPARNTAATVLGIMMSGKPTAGGVLAPVRGAPVVQNALRVGTGAAVANAPFALARQQGKLPERIPNALREEAVVAGTAGTLGLAGGALEARGARARVSPPSPQRVLSNEGVQLTPGQMLGGSAQRAEDALTSLPITGDAVREARIRGVEGFDRAALNRPLAAIGETLPARINVGRDGVRHVETRISEAYGRALNGVTVQPDNQFAQDVVSALVKRQLPEDAAGEVDSVLANVADRLSGKPIDGQTWKAVDAELRAARDSAYAASATKPSMRFAGDALADIRKALQENLGRASPEALAGVRAADEATANLARIRQASQYTGTSARGGVFTASDLNRAVQGLDTSAGNREFARGDALMQDLTEPAMQVLPQRVPDSGTPLRSIFTMLGAGGLATAAHADPATIIGAVVGLTAGAGAYSRPVMALVNAAYRAGGRNPGAVRETVGQLTEMAARNPELVPLLNRVKDDLLTEGPSVPVQPQQGAPVGQTQQ